MIFIRHPFNCALKCLDFESTEVNESVVKNAIVSHLGFDDFTLFRNGRKVQDEEIIPQNSTVHVIFSLPGGKGGFGSMLRAIGAQIEKTTNREACRDLSGRRLRDINEEQRLKKWIAKEAEREADKIRRRKARIERLKTKPAHKFFDFEYEKEISELPERINDALSEGLQKVNQPAKRPAEEAGSSKPPKKTWLSEEFSSSSDSEIETHATGNESPSKKQKTDSCDTDISDLSQPGPSSSQSSSHYESEESSTFASDGALTDIEKITEQSKSSADSIEIILQSDNTGGICSKRDSKMQVEDLTPEEKDESVCHGNEDVKVITVDAEVKEHASKSNTEAMQTDEDSLPIDLLDFQSASDLEALGINKLKLELMSRGLKCGGTISDRAQRLWKVRGLQSSKYPTNLLAKSKK